MMMNPRKVAAGVDASLAVIEAYEKDKGFKRALSDLKKAAEASERQVGELVKATADYERVEKSVNAKNSALTKRQRAISDSETSLEAGVLSLDARTEQFEDERSDALLDIEDKLKSVESREKSAEKLMADAAKMNAEAQILKKRSEKTLKEAEALKSRVLSAVA